MKHTAYIFLLSVICILQPVSAQKLIRHNSRYYVESQSLPGRVDPLLSDTWHQYAPFNNMCPIDTATNERCVVGCVATAMSQVMHYWRWPLTYDWDNILDTYTEGSYSQAQADAVAKLSSDCGVAVNMNYTSSASGARSILQAKALATSFGYDCGIQMYFRDFYSLNEITLMIKKELAAGRPVLISGYNKNGGHAFVIDGYDENDCFHTNWGNPGHEDDSWTYLPNMVPNQPQWYSPDNPENGLNILQMFTLGIMPDNDVNATGIERHLFAFQSIKAVKDSINTSATYSRDDVRLTVHDMSDIGWNLHNDSVSLMLMKDGKRVVPLYTYYHDFLLEEVDDTTYTDTLSLQVPESLQNGTYTIVPMYKDNALDGGKEWREARTCTGTPNYLIARVGDNDVTISSDTVSTSYLTLEAVDFPDLLLNTKAPEYELKFRNHGPEMAGRIYLLMESLDGGKAFYLQRQGVTIGANEEYTIHYDKSKVSAPQLGIFRLHVLYESNLFADNLIELEMPQEIIVSILTSGYIQIAAR